MNLFVALRVYHDFLCTFPGWGMHLEPGFGCNRFSADRTATVLPTPNRKQLFPPFCVMQHLFTLAFLKIFRPIFIERVRFRNNFLKANNFGIGCVFEFCVIGIFIGILCEGGECPLPVANVMPVSFGNPFAAFLFVSAFGPLSQALIDSVVHPAKHF